MTPEEKLHRAVWDILDELKQESLIVPQDEWILLDTDSMQKERAIKALIRCGAIRIIKSKYPYAPSPIRAVQIMQGFEEKPIGYYLELLQPKFNEIIDFYYNNIGKNIKSDYLNYEQIALLTKKLTEWQNTSNNSDIKPNTDKDRVGKNNKNQMPEIKKVEKFIIVELNEREQSIEVIVNDKYNNPVSFDKNKRTGDFLLKYAEITKKRSGPLRTEDHKASVDFLNSERSPFTKKLGLAKTKIFESRNGYIEPTIEITVIGRKAYKQRRKQHTKT